MHAFGLEHSGAAQEREERGLGKHGTVVGRSADVVGRKRQGADEQAIASPLGQERTQFLHREPPRPITRAVATRSGKSAEAAIIGRRRLVLAAFDEAFRRLRRFAPPGRRRRVDGAGVGEVRQQSEAYVGESVEVLDAAPLARVVDVEQRRRRGDVSEGGHERANALPPLRGAVGDEIGPWIAGPHDQRARPPRAKKLRTAAPR